LTDTVGCGGGDCVGTRGADTITGSFLRDRIAAMEGNDVIEGDQDTDDIYGDEGNDTITGAADAGDNDTIFGDQGNDNINVREGDAFPDIVKIVGRAKGTSCSLIRASTK
jgi:Ca2+-binding RTX toxin-like protein